MQLTAGSKLGPYEILSPIGAGGMGEVYRARDPKLNRELAVKVLPEAFSTDRDFLARFQAEARAASALNHPNIVTVHDIGEAGGVFFILMELVDGRTVRELIEPGRLPLRKVLQIAAQAAEGLAAAHARGIVHRDLKPENLMLTKDGVVKILDFGLAKSTGPVPSEDRTVSAGFEGTQPGTVLGTVGYMSPEQASGRPVDFRSDQFSFGSILYEMLAGSRAWRRDTPAESLAAIIREEPAPLSAASPEAPTALRWIVERCLAKDPEDRYGSTRDLARDLRALLDHFSDLSSGGGIAGVPDPARPRLGAPAFALAAAALLLGAAAAWQLRPAPRSSGPPHMRYLTYSGRDSEPAVSPDGKVVAFASERTDRKRIWLKQLADGSEAVLTAGPDRSPRFSPDGATILFSRREGAVESLYRVPVVGGEPRRVVENAFAADYSPDGKQVAFVRQAPEDGKVGYRLIVAPASGSPEKVIHRVDALIVSSVRWSPDGRFVSMAYSLTGALGGIPWKIAIVPSSGGTARELSPEGRHGMVSTAIWSGDGRELVYAERDPGYFSTTGRVGRQIVASGKTHGLFSALNLGITLDYAGPESLVYEAASIRGNLRQQALPGGGAPEAGPDGRWLTRGYGVDRQPVYSPDGGRVIFTSNRDGNMNIWELVPPTGSVRRLTDDPSDDWDPYLTRDGKSLLWSSKRTGSYEIWIANADGTNPRQLSHDRQIAEGLARRKPGGGAGHGASAIDESSLGDAENPTATPDGAWVVYGAYGRESAGVWRVRVDGSEPHQIVAGTFRDPSLSPDGRFIVVTDLQSAPRNRILRADDGQFLPYGWNMQLNTATGQAVGRVRWAPDGRSVYVGGLDDRGLSGVFRSDFDPVAPQDPARRPVAGFDADQHVDGFAVSPDGRHITLAVTEQPSDLVLVEGLEGLPPPPRRPGSP